MSHEFLPLHSRDSVARYCTAACSCGWVGVYTHAFEKYARPDWEQHVAASTKGGERRQKAAWT